MSSLVSFAHPSWLWWLLMLVPIFALRWWHKKRKEKTLIKLAQTSSPVLAKQMLTHDSAWVTTRQVLWGVSFALLVVALAGPQLGKRTVTLKQKGVDVVIALDFSKSMLAEDVKPSRIERAKREIINLLAELGTDRVGLVAFAGETMEFPMTSDYGAVAQFLEELGPYDMPVGGTAIGRALVSAKHLLDRSKTDQSHNAVTDSDGAKDHGKIVVLMTDGEDHEGDPEEAAKNLAESGIRLITVGIGTAVGEPIPSFAQDGTRVGYQRDKDGNVVTTALRPENGKKLQSMAASTGGVYIAAKKGDVGVQEIKNEIRKMKAKDQQSRRLTFMEPRFALFLFPAWMMLLLEAFLPVGRKKPNHKGKKEAHV